ncbi:MAG: Glu-tRNA(Gln) amidotransferase subunit GatE [Thermoplasmata archaeon]|nr:Glu-tRNA(Gln) amidotransferase subunit GatE [Thermoplasmata archaeon]
MDYEKLGFKAGLEIHQQLATHKLFCNCESELEENEKLRFAFSRRLRPVQSEQGDVDRAAIEEARRGKKFLYYAGENACLVEADEEPPHSANEDAIDAAIMVSLLLNADLVDEIHFMRKIVIDGSNTTGFQRTALIALNGSIDGIGIETICLEEDAARKIGEERNEIKYALDRLGIPLIEIATAPDIKSPKQAMEIALKIGMLLRAMKRVKRGIGTIRQDLNVSIREGARVEIKGVQELNDIPKILENEVKRQIELIEVAKELKRRKAKEFKEEIKNVESIFEKTKSKFLQKNKPILACRLPKFKGLLGGVKYKEHRLGKELAMYAKSRGGGIMHSDELPNYGISIDEVKELRKFLNCGNEDAFIISAGKNAMEAIKIAAERAKMALKGVPEEVRKAMPDGSSSYMRPLPGAARMYPETDVPPIKVDKGRVAKIKAMLPEMPDEKIKRMIGQYGLSREEARQLVYSGRDELFEEMARKHGHEKVVARILLNVLSEMEKEGYDVNEAMARLDDVMHGLEKKMYAKEAIDALLRYLAANKGASMEEAIEKCGIRAMSEEEIKRIIKKIVKEKANLIEERKEKAISPLMGIIMKELRGKADGALINKLLTEEIKRILKTHEK